MLIVDAANVIGSRPDGWWRDRAGAARALVERVRSAVDDGALDASVVIVLEGNFRAGAPSSPAAGVTVVHAPGSGDDAIVGLAGGADPATVVTADRGLRRRVADHGADVVGPGWLLDRLG